MSASALANLEALLRARKLGRTLPSSAPLVEADGQRAPTDIAPVDRALGGGWRRGELSEIVGPASSGRTWLATHAVGAATRRGELAAWIDTCDRLDPVSAGGVAIVWERMLHVRGVPLGPVVPRGGRDEMDGLARAVDRAVKALAILLTAGGFGLVVLDLADVPARTIGGLPFTTWLRVHRMLDGRDTAGVIVASTPVSRSPGGVSLRLAANGSRARWTGASPRARRFAGFDVHGQVVSARGGDSESFEVLGHR